MCWFWTNKGNKDTKLHMDTINIFESQLAQTTIAFVTMQDFVCADFLEMYFLKLLGWLDDQQQIWRPVYQFTCHKEYYLRCQYVSMLKNKLVHTCHSTVYEGKIVCSCFELQHLKAGWKTSCHRQSVL